MTNSILDKFKKGQKTIGTMTHMRSSTAVECLGHTGLDFVVIDLEHSPVTSEGADAYILAAGSAGLAPLVRVDGISRSAVLKMLDAGAQAVIVPCVETVDQAAELVGYAKFAPLGARGFCPTRDGGWGRAAHAAGGPEEYMRASNSETLLILQCETAGCLESIETITSVEGVDGILIGPYDLSIALGKPAQFHDPELQKAFRRILGACKTAGKMCMIYAGNAAAAKDYLEQGFDSVIAGLDTDIYISAYCEIVRKSMH